MSKVSWNQNGYVGCSMSVRAAEAYDSGLAPKSKWSKEDILNAIEESWGEEIRKHVENWTKQYLADTFLVFREWHHTGKYLQETDFYGIIIPDEDDDVTAAKIMQMQCPRKKRKKAEKKIVVKKYAVVYYGEWERYGNRFRKIEYKAIASWTETNGKASMANIYTTSRDSSWRKQKKRSSFYVDKELKRMPAKNEKIWETLGRIR